MKKPIIAIHDIATGEVIEREMNAEELAQLEIDKQSAIDAKSVEAAKAAEKQAILDQLGITAEQAKLLLS
jgi:hypothetical protein